ncbi:uncharacterized protein LOC110835804 [Zootermopsis nevadensis]|uniref:Uncharacterized protein n=1 Tax=Zootermopsis nevadensis TaxID=136037 RepID=A0A067R4P4_ZOONE|nr:uncharacterized protein LOC110835804 [Zootermopsis nevadensis]KDR12948.1 hypothetical protein L798_12905 [Zootermopsis nevadensis]
MCKKEMCRLEITVAARFVGVFGLVISVIVMSQLISELAHHDGRGKIIALLGINIEEFDTNEDNATVMKRNDSKIIMLNNSVIENNSTITKGMAESNYFLVICFLFALAQVLANALLIWGTIVEKRCYTVPWFLCETGSLSVQVLGYVYYVIHKQNELDAGVFTAAIVNMVVTIYFWYIVFRAQERWNREGLCEDIPHAVVMTKSTEVSKCIDKLSDSPQLPIVIVTSEPALII